MKGDTKSRLVENQGPRLTSFILITHTQELFALDNHGSLLF